MISPRSQQEILEAARIEDIVGDFVSLKRRGVNFIGLCPFHGEKSPSFNVNPARNIFKCFGCGESGDSVGFLRKHMDLSFPDSLMYIAKKYNLQVEEVEMSREFIETRQEEESLLLVNEFAKSFYHRNLLEVEEGKAIGLSYFKERGFLDATIDKFQLGFAPERSESLTMTALRTGYKMDQLKELKLCNDYEKDFFRNRVMFPIFNLAGKVVAFAGRTLSKEKDSPKYINSPESAVYHKSKILYGAHLARNAFKKQDECIVVEGYADVISLVQAGLENVVAPCGTALTEDQGKLIKRFTENVVFLFDGDKAGVNAALKNLPQVLKEDLNVKIVILPESEDPDSYVTKHGAEAMRQYIEDNKKDFIYFKTELRIAEINQDPIKKVKLLREIVELIAVIPDPMKRSIYIKEVSRRLEMDEQSLVSELNKVLMNNLAERKRAIERNERLAQNQQNTSKNQGNTAEEEPFFPGIEHGEYVDESDFLTQKAKITAKTNKVIGNEFQERDIIRILINAGDQVHDKERNVTIAEFVLSNIQDVLEDFDNKTYEKIAKACMERLVQGEKVDFQFFINNSDEVFRKTAVDMTTEEFEYSANWIEMRAMPLQSQETPENNFFLDSTLAIKRFKLHRLMRMSDKNQVKIKELSSDSAQIDQLMLAMKVHQKILEMRNDLAKELGTVILK